MTQGTTLSILALTATFLVASIGAFHHWPRVGKALAAMGLSGFVALLLLA